MPRKIKDSIYGYIEIDDNDVMSVIDNSAFQRLRDIRQTGYASVYPCSSHNRFSHSLGVYHLGGIVAKILEADFNRLIKNCKEFVINLDFSRYRKLFVLACLCHDIGHAPFSHSSEHFYLEHDSIWEQLRGVVRDKAVEWKNETGAPHEIMSALVALRQFKSVLKKIDEKSFFARCIIGLKYTDKNPETEIKNCFISLLNSNTIDVDKLDYLIRDSVTIGFKSVDIDYNRLLSSYCFRKKNDSIILTVNKSALSVLESVIFAHDMERKWIQNHPVILYEDYLVKYAVSECIKSYRTNEIDLFSYDAITEKGVGNDKERVVLLSDSDIISFLKKKSLDFILFKEFFDRKSRKKPVWKSEAEFNILFEKSSISGEAVKQLVERFEGIENSFKEDNLLPVINDDLIKKYSDKINLQKAIIKDTEIELKRAMDLFKLLKAVAEDNGMSFEYVIITSDKFNTGFDKAAFKQIQIYFPAIDMSKKLEDCIVSLQGQKKEKNKFFYLYINEKATEKFRKELIDKLLSYAQQNYLEL